MTRYPETISIRLPVKRHKKCISRSLRRLRRDPNENGTGPKRGCSPDERQTWLYPGRTGSGYRNRRYPGCGGYTGLHQLREPYETGSRLPAMLLTARLEMEEFYADNGRYASTIQCLPSFVASANTSCLTNCTNCANAIPA